MKRKTPIFILTIIGLIFFVPLTFYHLIFKKTQSDNLAFAIFGSLSLILLFVLIIERAFIFLVDKKSNLKTEKATSTFYEKNKFLITISQISIIVFLFSYFFLLTNQPKYYLTIDKNVNYFGVYEGEKKVERNLIKDFISGNKKQIINKNGQIVFDDTDDIEREIETKLDFEYGAMTDQYMTFEFEKTKVGLRIYTIGSYHITKSDSLKIMGNLKTKKPRCKFSTIQSHIENKF